MANHPEGIFIVEIENAKAQHEKHRSSVRGYTVLASEN